MSPEKVALITGTNRGLGRALVEEAARLGYRVFAGVRSAEAAATWAGVANVEPLILDVTNAAQRAEAVERVRQAGGKLDLLIHNAGINSSSRLFGPAPSQVTFGELTGEALLGTAHTNAIAPLLFTQELAPALRAAGGARVVAISSWFASIEESGARDYNFGYTGSKALLNAYFRLAANALAPDGVVTLMVNPGWMRTDMGGERAERTPEESAASILALASRATAALNGAFLDWNGEPHAW